MTADGLPWPLPATVAAVMKARGVNSICPPRLYLEPPPSNDSSYLTISQAAQEHLEDVMPFAASDRKYQLDAARKRILRACKRGEIIVATIDGNRRLDADSFRAWRLRYREQALDAADDR